MLLERKVKSQSFTNLSSVVHDFGLSDLDQEVSRLVGLAVDKSIWICQYPYRRTNLSVFKALILPIFFAEMKPVCYLMP